MAKNYTITVTVDEKNNLSIERINHGFTAFELIGIFDFCKNEITETLKPATKPFFIKRQVIDVIKTPH